VKPPFPHQEFGLDWVRRSYNEQKAGHVMAWAMRAGKSRTSVEFIAEIVKANEVMGERVKAVVVCPAQVRKNWAREFRKWTNIEAVLVSPGKKVDVSGPGVYITSYELAKVFKDDAAIDVVVLDEMHYLASEKSLRSRAVRGCVSANTFVIGLSGTPIPNTPRFTTNGGGNSDILFGGISSAFDGTSAITNFMVGIAEK
jgi:SNF2 family DNA or RNA helicase